jgi:hypothetical protein
MKEELIYVHVTQGETTITRYYSSIICMGA